MKCVKLKMEGMFAEKTVKQKCGGMASVLHDRLREVTGFK